MNNKEIIDEIRSHLTKEKDIDIDLDREQVVKAVIEVLNAKGLI